MGSHSREVAGNRSKTAKQIIIEALRSAGRPLTASEIARITGLKYNTVRGRLQDLKREGIVEYVGVGWTLKSGK